MTREKEKGFQQAVLELAEWARWRAYHTFDSRFSQKGFPDLVLVRAPRIIFAELKRLDEELKPDQVDWIDALQNCPGVETYVWRPHDWPQIEAVLARTTSPRAEAMIERAREEHPASRRRPRSLGW